MIATKKTDLWGENISIGDQVRAGLKSYIVKYGNYKYLGTDRVGIFLENLTSKSDVLPIEQARTIVRL